MKKFIVLYHSPKEAMEMMANATDEEKAEGMKPWLAWQEECGDALVEMGSPLGQGREFSKETVKDCSGAASGYSILQGANMDEINKYLENHPHLNWMDNCKIQVFEAVQMG
jgi:hypothetical protein